MARFDWYQATIKADVNDVLASMLDLDECTLKHSKGAHGYAHTTAVLGPSGRLGHVWHGGSHLHPHVVVTGEDAQRGAEMIRVRFPGHTVTRADVCEDFADVGAFDRITPHLLSVAQSHRVKLDTRGDHLLTKKGRTIYLGSAASATRLRLYDKAAELRNKFAADPFRLASVPENLTRLEAQVRPQTQQAKATFATIEPMQVMGSSAWLRALWSLVAGLELHPVQVGKGYRQADDERAYAYLLAQYGGLLRRMCVDLGDWACVGKQLGNDLAARDGVR